MKSSGTPTWIRSQRFNAPETGRLSIEVWIRANQVGVQPALRLAIEAKHFGKEYYRFAGVGSLAGDSGASPINDQWQKYVVHFDDLPTEGLSQIQIGFDLMSRGDVMIDQVAVYDRWFDESDARAMTQRVALARHLIDEGRCENARQILDGYWFKFLETYVSEQNSQPHQADPIEVEASSPRLLDRMRGIVPRRFFRFR